MRGGISWALLGAIASVCASCTYLLGVQDLELEPGAAGSGGAGGEPTTTTNTGGGGAGGAGGGTGGTGGCPDCPVELATGQTNPSGIVVHGMDVYWINDNSIVMVADPAEPSGARDLFTRVDPINEIAVNAGNIYVRMDNGTIEEGSLPLSGEPTAVGGVASATHMAADETTFYWWDNNQTVYQGASTPVQTGMIGVRAMIADTATTTLFWARDVAVGSFPLGGGTLTTLRDQIASPGVGALALDLSNIYWYDQAGDKIVSNPRTEPNMISDTATGVATLIDMAAVNGEVYWIEVGDVWKWSGGMKERLYPGENATSIDVDETHVYWTTGGSQGRVKKAPL